MSEEAIEFNRVTFGLPVEGFRIEAFLSLGERLPIVTEFVLRLIRVCEAASPAAVKSFFGFTDSEMLSVLNSLQAQGLVTLESEVLTLTQYASDRFDEAGGDNPMFSKVERQVDDVNFDLLSFSPLARRKFSMLSDNYLRLDAKDETLSRSVDMARQAYLRKFTEVCRVNNKQDGRFGVQSVIDVESRRRGYHPVSVSFCLDSNGRVERLVDPAFEESAPEELRQAFHEAISAHIPSTLTMASIDGFSGFVEAFELNGFASYIAGKRFDLYRFARDVKQGEVGTPKGMLAIFGALYLPENRKRIIRRIEDRRLGNGSVKPKCLRTSAVWMLPDEDLCGRGDDFIESKAAVSTVLGLGGADRLHVMIPCEARQEYAASAIFRRDLSEVDLYIPRSDQPLLASKSLELFIYPSGFVAALFHVTVPSGGVAVPVGFVSSRPKDFATALRLLTANAGGEQYLGFAVRSGQVKREPFADRFPFLQFSPLVRAVVDADEDEAN